MAELFGVSTDTLLRDDMDLEEQLPAIPVTEETAVAATGYAAQEELGVGSEGHTEDLPVPWCCDGYDLIRGQRLQAVGQLAELGIAVERMGMGVLRRVVIKLLFGVGVDIVRRFRRDHQNPQFYI